MTVKEKYDLWLTLDEGIRAELASVKDEKEIEDRFYRDLEFGTGGLRGVMGAGTNRMNIYTVRRATKGLADYLDEIRGESAVIAYDTRCNSELFASEAARVLCAAGIRVYLFSTPVPTPVLSFAVRYFGCEAGIVITASHNPKEYNGYKVYDSKGCQILPACAKKVIDYVNAVEDLTRVPVADIQAVKENCLLEYVGDEVLDTFLSVAVKPSVYREKTDLKVVYTPLHGTGKVPVQRILSDMNVSLVKEQEVWDGEFSTVRSPNPEERDALTLAIKQAQRENADIVIGTDPDCDRVGSAVLHGGEYVLLTGNQVGALLTDFIISNKKPLPPNATVVKTIVTSELGADIARKAGLKTVDTLTGFKYIGEQICNYEFGSDNEFLFGYEESFGYLAGTHSRDKDAVVTSRLICEMAAYYKGKGKTLIDALNSLYAEYGYYYDYQQNFVLTGKSGAEKIKLAMDTLRNGKDIFENVKEKKDYLLGIEGLPSENVLKYVFNDGAWVAVRPSGTEPKLKVYYSVKGKDRESAVSKTEELCARMNNYITNL